MIFKKESPRLAATGSKLTLNHSLGYMENVKRVTPDLGDCDFGESFETARPVRVTRSNRLIEMHSAADRYFALWLESGNPDDIRRAAALAGEARKLEANP